MQKFRDLLVRCDQHIDKGDNTRAYGAAIAPTMNHALSGISILFNASHNYTLAPHYRTKVLRATRFKNPFPVNPK